MVWPLGAGAEGQQDARQPTALIGEAGASLMRLGAARFPVPPGFVISAEVCAFYVHSEGRFPLGVWDQIRQHLSRFQHAVINERDRGPRPLLLRVHVGAPWAESDRPPPTMVLGFSERAAEQLAEATGRTAPGWRGWARLLRAYGATVLQTPADVLEDARARLLRRHHVASETALSTAGARELCAQLRRVLWDRVRQPVPVELEDQLRGLLAWTYEQWAKEQRAKQSGAALRLGVPVVATVAVLSDLDESSVACTAWSRDPLTGAPGVSGRLLADDTQPPDPSGGLPLATLAMARDPHLRVAHGQIQRYTQRAEDLLGWPQMVDYVVESGRLWIVGATAATAPPAVTLRWAVDLAGPGAADRRGPVRDVLLRLSLRDLQRQPRASPASRRLRETVLQWCRAHRRLQVWSWQMDPHPPAGSDTSAHDGVLWWMPSEGESQSQPEQLWAGFERLITRYRGRPMVLMVPREWLIPPHALPGEGAASSSLTARPLAPLLPILKRAVRARSRPHLALAVPVGDLERPGRLALEALHRAVRDVEASLGRRWRIEIGVAVDCPRAALVLDSIGEQAGFAVLDLARLDAALRGRGLPSDETEPRSFDAEGLGALLETGVRRIRKTHPPFWIAAAWRGMVSPALLRLCLRWELKAIAVPDELTAPTGLAAAQASLRLEAEEPPS